MLDRVTLSFSAPAIMDLARDLLRWRSSSRTSTGAAASASG